MNKKIIGTFHIHSISEKFDSKHDLDVILEIILKAGHKKLQRYKAAIIYDYFTETGGDERLIENKLKIINEELILLAPKFGSATAKMEVNYVPVADDQGDIFNQRKSYNLVIQRD
jgi:hypothetical protein